MPLFLAFQLLYALVLPASCAFAIWRGGADERAGAAIMLVGSAVSVIFALLPAFDWAASRGGLVAVDLGVLAALLVLALRTTRFWPLWMTAFHLIGVTTHLAVLLQPSRALQAYAMLQGFWAYPMLAARVIGTAARSRGERSLAPAR